jgi:hypothetical protein
VTGGARLLALPVTALVLVSAVLGAQVAAGGARFEPLRPADPCAVHSVASRAGGLDGLTERLVLLGLDRAACRLHVTREALTLELARSGVRTDHQLGALRAGLVDAVTELRDDGSLPPASALVDDALDTSDLNPFLKAAIRALPDSVVDATLKTDDVLTRTIDDLDLRALLRHLDDPDALQRQLDRAVTQAVESALTARLHDLL